FAKLTAVSLLTVLDVGAGLGLSKGRIPNCTTQDPGPGLAVDLSTAVEDLPDRGWDYVTAFDVIEHVVEDTKFLGHLARIARLGWFITTPNYNVSKAANGCHCREYTPAEFLVLLPDVGVTLWVGDGKGLHPYQVNRSEFSRHDKPHQAALVQ